MDTIILPPSPNWHLNRILACNDNGLLAYGSRGEVTIIDYKKGNKFTTKFLHLAHKEKLNCVVFSPLKGKFNNCLATCGDDGMVRLWDYQKLSLLLCHSGHKDGVRVMGLDWSRVNYNRIVSVNDLGSIVCWDLVSNTIRRLHCGIKVLPLCLACCPHDKDIIAIGCKGGATLVIDLKGNGKIIHRLRGNEQDVISISWCPVPYNVIKTKKNMKCTEVDGGERDLLLATGGLDKFIYIWRTGSDGRYEVILNLPNSALSNPVLNKKKGYQNMTANMVWTCIHWVDPYTLLSSSQFGELLSWDLNKVYSNNKGGKKAQPRLIHYRHHKGLFSIASPVVSDTLVESHIVWTTAMDKRVVGTSLASASVVIDIPTVGGAVICMAVSPLDPNRLAIGSSDSKVFVWNISELYGLNLTTYWKKIVGKVMALCWHPSEEELLAYGTSDGHVGLLDLGSSKPPMLLRLYLRKTVYRITWALPVLQPVDGDTKLVLFAVGDGDVLQFTADPKEPDEEPKSMNKVLLNSVDQSLGLQKTLARSDIAFKPDQSCFAITSENGSVYIINLETLELQHTLYPHKKLVNSVEWHPATVTCDNSISPCQHWLASCSESVKVHNIPSGGKPELVATLNGHSGKVVSLAWSPHFHGRLLSASYDCTYKVWDVAKQTCLAVCSDHSTPVMCALFSPLDTDIVISGSNDSTVRFSAASKMPACSSKPEKKRNRQEIALRLRSEAEEATELTVGMFDISQIDGDKIGKQKNCSNTSIQSASSTRSSLGSDKGMEDYKRRQMGRSMFPVTANQVVHAQHFEVLMKRMASSDTTSYECDSSPSAADIGYLDFFGDDKDMFRLLLVEESRHIQNKQFVQAQHTALWRGNVTQMVREAITKKQLSDWLVSIAPTTGFELWEEACQVYSDQLVECGDVSKASTYLLAIHKVQEAVQLLVDHKLYREAVAVAKCRLPSGDPLISATYMEWANSAKLQGQLLLAAHCFLVGGDTQACVEVLSRIKELRWMRVAAQVARQAGQIEQANSLELECLTLSVTSGHLSVAYQLLADTPQYQCWSVWLQASELLAKVKNRSEAEVFGWLEGHKPGHLALFVELHHTCVSAGPVYHQLLPHLPTNKTPDSERDMWSYVSGQLVAACAARLETTLADFLRHTVSAASTAFHYQTSHPTSLALPLILSLLAPNGLFAEGSILKTVCKREEEHELLKSLRAFACASIVHWMNNNWQKVSDLLKNGEGGSGTSVEYKMAWLPQLLESCSADVLDTRNVEFFVKKAQKEQLQDVINKETVQNKCIKSTEENANSKTPSQTVITKAYSTNCGDKSNLLKDKTETVGLNLNVLMENCTLETAQGESDPLEAKITNSSPVPVSEFQNKNVNEIVQSNLSPKFEDKKKIDCEIKNCVNNGKASEKDETSQTVQISKNVENQHDCNPSLNGTKTDPKSETSEHNASCETDSFSTLNNGTTTLIPKYHQNSNIEHLNELNKVLNKFKADRESVPSPFIAYINIKYLIDNLVSVQDVEIGKRLQENCDKIWKGSMQ